MNQVKNRNYFSIKDKLQKDIQNYFDFLTVMIDSMFYDN